MQSISIETILTIIYVRVDDWYELKGKGYLAGKVGKKPTFKDSEVMTLVLAADFIPYPGERQYVGYLRANYRHLFPDLVDQSQFNRRARSLHRLIEHLRRDWLLELGVESERQFLMDTKPIPVVGYKRSKKHSAFQGSADYGVCASRHLHYFGYKLVMIPTLTGIPVLFDLVPASTEERQAAERVLPYLANAEIFGDKGFLGVEWQAQIHEQTGNYVITPRRKNQKIQYPDGVERLLNRVRERIEGVFHEIQNTGRNIERLLAKTVVGLTTRVIAKVTSHLLRYLLKVRFAIDIQSFQSEFAF
jgi:hypothetical protein